MWDYSVFGGVLRSQLPFPELVSASGRAADWTMRVVRDAPSRCDAQQLGERQTGAEHYRLWRLAHALRLEYSHAGIFDVSIDGSTIVWYCRGDVPAELVRTIVLGPALAIALEQRGLLCLHGSAVAVKDRTIAFVAPKHYGKSTLATALVGAGAQLLGDDLVAITPDSPPRIRPGIASVRLWEDAATHLEIGRHFDQVLRGVKTTAANPVNRASSLPELPVGGIYVLHPQLSGDGSDVVRRERLSSVGGAVTLAHHAKLPDSLVGLEAASKRIRVAARVATEVPVWRLEIVRDLKQLSDIAHRIIEWHEQEDM